MTVQVEIVLKGRDFAVTENVDVADTGGGLAGNDGAVRDLLVQILRAIARAEDPASPADRDVVLQGFSWIVEPVDAPAGHVVIAIEIPMGAAVAGPLSAVQADLDETITRVLWTERKERMGTVH